MPYDAQLRCLVGADAHRPGAWAAEVLVEFLTSALADGEGPYFALLELSAERLPLVTLERERAAAFHAAQARATEPVATVLVRPGEGSAQPWRALVAGLERPGLRHHLHLEVDVAWPLVRQDSAEMAQTWAAAVASCLQAGTPGLEERGLFHPRSRVVAPQPEAGERRHVVTVECLVRCLVEV